MLLWYFEFPCAWLVITQSVGRVRTWVLKEMEALSSFTFFTAMELPWSSVFHRQMIAHTTTAWPQTAQLAKK